MIDYSEYLTSSDWQAVRELALLRARHKCQICGSNQRLDVHHNTYDNLGNEREHLEDLVVLCAEHHQVYHDSLAEVERLTDSRLEETMIGVLLQESPEFFETVLPYLSVEVFTSRLRQEVFKYLHSRTIGKHLSDPAIVISYLSQSRLLTESEAKAFVTKCIDFCTNSRHGEDYAQVLHELYLRRRIQQLPAKITKLNRNYKQSVTELVDTIQAEIQLIADKKSNNRMELICDTLIQTFQDIESRHRGIASHGLPCGFYSNSSRKKT